MPLDEEKVWLSINNIYTWVFKGAFVNYHLYSIPLKISRHSITIDIDHLEKIFADERNQ